MSKKDKKSMNQKRAIWNMSAWSKSSPSLDLIESSSDDRWDKNHVVSFISRKRLLLVENANDEKAMLMTSRWPPVVGDRI